MNPETLNIILLAFRQVALDPQIWGIIIAAAIYGVFMGAVPGLTATMGVALIIPLTYYMQPVAAIAAIVTLVACAIFAGDIPTTLLRIPGTPASAAYAEDVYALMRAGQGRSAMITALGFSVVGGLFGVIVLVLFAQPLAHFATYFSVSEYFWLYLLGLSCAVMVSRGSALRAGLGLVIGLLLSTVGLSAVHTQARFTFGQPELYQGINFIPAMIGLFGLSEILRNVIAFETGKRSSRQPISPKQAAPPAPRDEEMRTPPPIPVASLSVVSLLWRRKTHLSRSSLIGATVGLLPGAGADIASWVSMAASKKWSKRPQDFGRGSLEGISDATAANSSALAGAWIPALVFGIPGDSVTAIVIGVLLMKNVQPGPEIFQKQATLVYSIYWVFLLANLVLIPIGLAAIKGGEFLVRAPRRVLLPIILLFCVLGAYAINGSYFDIGIMAVMGFLGLLLERRGVPLGPVVLGIILGGPLEERFVQTLTSSQGSLLGFFSRPIAAVLGFLTLAVWIAPLLLSIYRGKAERANAAAEPPVGAARDEDRPRESESSEKR